MLIFLLACVPCLSYLTSFKVGRYARVSTYEQQTPALQCDAMAAYATQRGWSIVITVEEVGAGVNDGIAS